jgi:hypothetical protein
MEYTGVKSSPEGREDQPFFPLTHKPFPPTVLASESELLSLESSILDGGNDEKTS